MAKGQGPQKPLKFVPEVQEAYLTLIRAGHGRVFSARQVGVWPGTVTKYRRASPEFDEAVREAEEEASEPVEAQLYEAAKAGEPWAVKEWLSKRSPDRWADTRKVEVSGSVSQVLEVGQGLGRVLELQRRLEERRDALGEAGVVVDAQSWENSEAPALGGGSAG